jgi:hypothetical protein
VTGLDSDPEIVARAKRRGVPAVVGSWPNFASSVCFDAIAFTRSLHHINPLRRYEKRGWLRTHLIANRRYILAAEVAEFNRRLASDEFADRVPNPSVAHSIKPKRKTL